MKNEIIIISALIHLLTFIYLIIRIKQGAHQKNKIKSLIEGGLATEGKHHKQWFIEQISLELKINIEGGLNDGIAP